MRADLGCGKSILTKAMINEGLLNSNTKPPSVYYFFFKDDNDNQITSA